MAIDFSQVKTITIPEGSVTKITDPTGNILWQSGSWHTIWEGSETITATKSGNDAPVISGTKENFAQTAAGTGHTPKIRITFSYSNTNTDPSWTTEFLVNPFQTKPSVSSPFTIEAVNNLFNNTRLLVMKCKYTADTKSTLDIGLWKKRDTENNRLIFQLKGTSANATLYSGNFTLTFTITKIEQYY